MHINFDQAWQSALAQHEGEERITSRVTPRVGRDSSGTGWQQLKMQVLSGFLEMGGLGGIWMICCHTKLFSMLCPGLFTWWLQLR